MNVFIVEDDNVLLLMLERMVARMGFNVVGTAQSGADAIREINKTTPDLILLDIILKDHIDGVTVAESISSNYASSIIYITGNSDQVNRQRAKKIGYHDYLIKPASYQELKSSIEKLISV
ncbi:MAG: response regulator [Balneolaceae bacterium]